MPPRRTGIHNKTKLFWWKLAKIYWESKGRRSVEETKEHCLRKETINLYINQSRVVMYKDVSMQAQANNSAKYLAITNVCYKQHSCNRLLAVCVCVLTLPLHRNDRMRKTNVIIHKCSHALIAINDLIPL